MASASTGTLQSGSAIITGMVSSSSTSTSATIVDAQLTTNNFQHQQKIQQTQHLQAVQQQQPLQHQPQQQQNHINNNLQFHHSSQNITAIQNRHSFVSRVGAANISHLNNGNPGNRLLTTSNVVLNNDSSDTIITQSRSTEMISHQQIQQQQQNHNNVMQEQQLSVQQQQQQQQPQQQQRQVHRIVNAANLAPGWRRLISNNEVIYVSPSGALLRNHGQIKDYLLSPGTCKCGLPCPLRPEYFFDFNSQVPNMPLQIPLENGLPSRSSLLCMHQRRFIENQQNIRDAKKRKFGDISLSGKLSTSTPAAQCNSVAIYSGGNVMQTSQVMASNNRIQMMSSLLVTHIGQQQQQQPQQPQQQLISNITFPVHHQQKINQSQQQQQQQIESLSVKVDEKQIGNVTISKTPPWRKNSILQQQQGGQNISQVQQNQITVSTATTGSSVFSTNSTNERVPPLPQSHLCQQQSNSQVSAQNVAPPWQDHHVQTRFVKNRASTSGSTTTKKKPNFRDDPTGYLDHQTAILHNSILNVVQSPDLNDTVEEDGFIISGNQSIKTEQQQQINSNEEIPTRIIGSNLKSLKSEQGLTVMQQNQTTAAVYRHPSSIIDETKNENTKIDKANYATTTSKYYTSTQTALYQAQQEKPQIKSEIICSASNFGQNSRIITSNRVVIDANLKNHNQEISGNHPQQQQHVVTNVPSSQQQISIEESSMQYQVTDDQQQQQQSICRSDSIITQPTTTSIGGQTVTHFPNGMVQVEQSYDNIVVSLKPQQQIQLQQQIQQHNILFRQNQQIQKSMSKTQLSNYQQQHENQSVNQKMQVPASQGSPIPSSTTYSRSTPDSRNTPEIKGPPQVGAISTSHESPHPCTSPIESPESPQLTIKTSISVHNVVHNNSNKNQQQDVFATSQTTSRNTITSVTAGKTITATTSANASDKSNTVNIIEPNNEIIHQSQKLSPGSVIPVSGLQLQPVVREPGNQLIMTSTGQIIVMPSQPNKSTNQVIINSPGGNNLVVNNQQSVLINQPNATATVVNNSQLIGNSVEVLNSQSNPSTATNLIQNPGSSLVIQNSGIVQTGQNIIQPSNNLIATSNNPNFIVNSSNNMQPMILNNSNILQQNGQNLIATNTTNIIQNSAAGSNLMATTGGTKVISNHQNIITNQSNVISNPQVLSNSNNIITNSGGIISQQTVVLNALPNGGYVIQPNFTTVDGQMVSQIVNQESSQTTFIQQQQPQQQRQIILTSPDSKRKAKKRKGSTGSSPPTPSSLSPQQSPPLQATNTVASQSTSQTQQQGTVVQIASQYPTQGFQISPGLQGIVVNKNGQASAPQQQIIFQNGQIIQPVNLIGQQLLVPAGLVMTPESTTLLQIQNVGPCGSIITPQGMVLRAPSPQNKSFLSPNGSGQQFIVSGNNQVSPLGQIYGAPVGLVVPQSNSGTTTFVQQNTTIVQQQSQQQQSTVIVSNSDSTVESHSNHGQGAISPPDTTTHSPQSPDRPPSDRSGGSDMVQCVSSSEPDSVVSPVLADSAQSPSTTDYDRGGNISYQNSNTIYKSEAKIRRVEIPPQFTTGLTPDITSQMRSDSHESPTNSPIASATSTTTTTSKNGHNNNSHNSIISGGIGAAGGGNSGTNLNQTHITSSFCIGELVWGAARGHPAWPGKIVNPPDGVCTPSDSTWVQWFGCRPNVELVAINSLKSLSEGLEAHHKAQKDTRKSRKLNSQLERAIQEAMTELDRISTMPQQPSTTTPVTTTKSRNRGRQSSNHLIHHQRSKPVRIAPAPPSTNTIQQQQQIRQQTSVSQVTNHQQSSSLVQQQQQQRTPSSTTQQTK